MAKGATKVLILAHDEGVGELLAAALMDAGYEADRARAPWEVAALARAQKHALLVVDLPSPRTSARSLLDVLAADAASAALPMLALCDSPALAAEALAFASVRGVVAKPFDLDDLLARVEETSHRAPCVGAICCAC